RCLRRHAAGGLSSLPIWTALHPQVVKPDPRLPQEVSNSAGGTPFLLPPPPGRILPERLRPLEVAMAAALRRGRASHRATQHPTHGLPQVSPPRLGLPLEVSPSARASAPLHSFGRTSP